MNGDGVDPGAARPGSENEIFARWFRDYHARVLAQCVRMLGDRAAAEDIAQETLLRAWLGRERMREEDIGAWLTVVARNLCISHMRRQKKQIPTEVLPETPDAAADPAHLIERAESRRAVRSAMRQVGERHRRLLFLHDIDGVEYEDLSAQLGLTPSGTRAVLFRARRVLRDRLAAVGEGFGAFVFGIRLRLAVFGRRTRQMISEPLASAGAQTGMNVALALGVAITGYGAAAPATAAAGVLAAPRAPRVANYRVVNDLAATSPVVGDVAPAGSSGTARAPRGGGPIRNDSYLGDKPGEGKIGGEVDDPTGGRTIVYIALRRQENPEKFSYTFFALDTVDAWACYPSPDTCDEIDGRFGEP